MSKERLIVEWRIVPSFTNYEVSSNGDVKRLTKSTRSIPGQTLSQFFRGGYPSVQLTRNGKGEIKPVHQLVCEAFHGPRPMGLNEIRHLDGDKLNNCKDNLRYGTNSENRSDYFKHNIVVGEKANAALFTNEYVVYLRSLYKKVRRPGGYAPKGWMEKLSVKEGINLYTLRNIIKGNGYPDAKV